MTAKASRAISGTLSGVSPPERADAGVIEQEDRAIPGQRIRRLGLPGAPPDLN